jgi:GT2 family glycosyltransferase
MLNPWPPGVVCAETAGLSAVVATMNRPESLRQTFESLASQSVHPSEIVVVDGSPDSRTLLLCQNGIRGLRSELRWIGAKIHGAASQRSEGVSLARHELIWFFDDDIVFEPECVARLWRAMRRDPQMGGVSAMIINQRYQSPRLVSKLMFTIMNGRTEKSFAGKVIGPAVNVLPEDRDELPQIVTTQWLNTTCTMYRIAALPKPAFPAVFTGYSLMEDLALSLEVGKKWKLANVRTARIFHDSQPADYKSEARALSCMELTNRHHVMTAIMEKRRLTDYARLGLWELFSLASTLRGEEGRRRLPATIAGKWDGLRQLFSTKRAL